MKEACIALVGNPNCGKTTLFNRLTGANQQIGNWPGVTVERKEGCFQYQSKTYKLVDLPGCYSLVTTVPMALDEKISCEYLFQNTPALLVNVVDAIQLQRDLYLTLQLREAGFPMVVAINRFDLAVQQGLKIDLAKLSEQLGCPVLPIVAKTGQGLSLLKSSLQQILDQKSVEMKSMEIPRGCENYVEQWAPCFSKWAPLSNTDGGLAIRALEGDHLLMLHLKEQGLYETFQIEKQKLIQSLGCELDLQLASCRHQKIAEILDTVLRKPDASSNSHSFWSEWIPHLDRWVMNRYLGIPLFLAVMYGMFFFAIHVAGLFQPFFDETSQALFVDAPEQLLNGWHLSPWLIHLMGHGIGKGLNITVTFIPVLAGIFFFLGLLEASGYLARAAFVMDRFMRALGLSGTSFVPMIIGFGCNVPAVLGSRTLQTREERILTIMMTPFMSCSARLAIYAVFVSAFFSESGQNVIFGLYVIGILVAILTGFILKTSVMKGRESPLIMEMPPYQWPDLRVLLRQVHFRLKQFVLKAGSLIVPLCVLITALGLIESNPHSGHLQQWGQRVSVIFRPLGVEKDNWPAAVGLLTGVMAKEVVVGTLNALYSEEQGLEPLEPTESTVGLSQALIGAFQTIPAGAERLGEALRHPLMVKANPKELSPGVMGAMVERFKSPAAAFAYLLFVLLYFPCVSVVAAMIRELNWGWGLFSVCWTTGVAYGLSVFFYQLATWAEHPEQSLLWSGGLITGFVLILRWIPRITRGLSMEKSVNSSHYKAFPTPICVTGG